jgi:uncharacterized protein DUF3300
MKRRLSYFFTFFLLLFSGMAWAKNDQNRNIRLSQEDLKQLVAPIALYPDPLLAQILPASTYPLEIVQAARIIHGEKDFPLIDSQDWDPSVKAVAHYPSVLEMMNDQLGWTDQLGQVVLNQQEDVLRAVQDLRRQAKNGGSLKSTPQQKVLESEEMVEIIPTNPEVVYVPTYDPEIVYAAPAVVAAVPLISFGFGYGLGSWLDTCFYWPGYSIIYGGPYYWGWHHGGWGHHHGDWNNWGWNHWRPRGGDFPTTLTRSNPPVFHGPPVNGNGMNPGPTRFPTNTTVNWTHDDRHGNPFNGRRTFPSTWSSKDNFPFHNAGRIPVQNSENNFGTFLKSRGSNPSPFFNPSGSNAAGRPTFRPVSEHWGSPTRTLIEKSGGDNRRSSGGFSSGSSGSGRMYNSGPSRSFGTHWGGGFRR